MKLKKGISLLLVLALSLMSFAFVVSAADDTVNVAIVADADTSALKVDDTFVANVELTDIAAKQLYAAQLKISYDPEVLQIVDEAGTATAESAKALIPCADVYKDGKGYFMYDLTKIDNEAGQIVFSAAKSAALIMDLTAKIDCPDGNYSLGGIRFKVVGTGLTGIEVDEPSLEIFCANGAEKAQASDKTEAIRIGLAKVVEVTNPADVPVDVDTALEDVLAELPSKVSAKFDDASVSDVAVTWACEDYKADVPGEYTFTGTLDAAGIDADGKTASVKVIVEKVEIVEAAADSVHVPFGATTEQIEALLPATAIVVLKNTSRVEVPVSWTYTYEAGVTTGDVAAEGTLDVGTKYLNTAEVKGALTLKVSAKIEEASEGTVETVFEDFSVAYEDEATKEDIIATLPKTVDVKVGDATVSAFITWDSEDYDAAKAGDYTFTGTITAPENVTLDSDEIAVTVTVEEAIEKKVVEVTDTLEAKTTKSSSTLKLVSLYPAEVNVEYQDGTTGKEAIVWDEASQNLGAKKAGTYTLNGKVGDVAVTASVTVEGSVTPPGDDEEDATGYVAIYLNNQVINYKTLNMFTSQIYVLQAGSAVTWSTSNQSIAFVTADGKLVGQNPGIATIYATAADGSIGYFEVKVTLNPTTIATIGDRDKNSESEEIVIPFTDLGDYSWAARMICELANDEIVSGKTATLYAPGDNVTRAEYASLLVRAMKLSTDDAGKEFTDVAQGEWYYNTVQTASALGIVSGYEDGSFRPNNSITREEMAVMTLRAADAAGRTLPTLVNVAFSDADQISGYAKDAVNLLACAQIINGMGDNNFAPQETANRAQAAVIIYKLSEL